ncbi:hypothetical protein K438DRAFT_1998221 [Mycena galopus ATCC 62051]|nr:hypothetical protein K438DRAFT_1998221 [Mycena galopus ATCC 62051]
MFLFSTTHIRGLWLLAEDLRDPEIVLVLLGLRAGDVLQKIQLLMRSLTITANPWSIAQNAGSILNDTTSTSDPAAGTSAAADPDDEFGPFYNEWDPEDFEEMERIERAALADPGPNTTSGTPEQRTESLISGPTTDDLQRASKHSKSHPFFSQKEGFSCDPESEDEGMESQNEEDLQDNASGSSSQKGSEKAWFDKPKGMPQWEYNYIRNTVEPIIRKKDGRKLAVPSIFTESNSRTGLPSTLWIRPPEPILAFPAILSRKGGLSKRLLTLLRGANQHKMGPTGVRSVLLEMQTLRFNTLQLQYLESIFELERGTNSQPRIHEFSSSDHDYPSFGDFSSPDKYNGFVPSVSYLTSMMNKAIELEEADADQHTACLSIDDLCVDDNHKVNKHIAKVDGVPIFGAMWTCMSGFYIRAQALTLTKGHDERLGPLMGIAASAKLYGYSDPAVVYSDDPVKDKSMLLTAFPTLGEKLTPMAAAHGLKSLCLPPSVEVTFLGAVNLVESALSSLLAPLDLDPAENLCMSLDAEWNISRQVGVSTLQIAPHSEPDIIYIIPVHRFQKLPTALLRLLVSPQFFLIGSAIKGDLTRLKKQFSQLSNCTFNLIDLKQFAIRRGVIKKNGSGALDVLAEKALGAYLPKDAMLRKTEEWEMDLSKRPELLNYAALDVFASRLIFEKINQIAPFDLVQRSTPAGTLIAVLVHEGGEIAAYGRIASSQPATFAGVRNSKTRLLVDIDLVVLPSAAAILHLDSSSAARTKSDALTLSQLQLKSDGPVFQIVSPLALLVFDRHAESMTEPAANRVHPPAAASRPLQPAAASMSNPLPGPSIISTQSSGDDSDMEDDSDAESYFEAGSETLRRQMFEAHGAVDGDMKGKKRALPDEFEEHEFDSSPLGKGLLEILHKLIESPADIDSLYTRIKKDIFHAFHMIPIPAHGLRAIFFRTLRDHIMRWDPVLRVQVDEVCRREFNASFDVMLIRDPRWIKEHVPRYIPPPSVLVPAIQHVYNVFGNAPDAETGRPLLDKKAWEKANAVLELAREGYLSDIIEGVVLYEKAGLDEYGLWRWLCKRGSNKLEGGPHGDIYRKFGAFNGEAFNLLNRDFTTFAAG